MGIDVILNYILIGAGALAALALAWMLIELAGTLRTARKTVVELKEELDPTLANVKTITEELQPTLAKVDPLIERVQLTVDAANLEIMRLDTIMSDLGDISGTLTSAVEAVDTVANAPLNLVNKATSKLNGVLGTSKAASDASKALGAKKEAVPAPQLEEPAVPVEEKVAQIADVARTVKEGYTTIVLGAEGVDSTEFAAKLEAKAAEAAQLDETAGAIADAAAATYTTVEEVAEAAAPSPAETEAEAEAPTQE